MKKTIYLFILLLPINLFLFAEEIPTNKSIDQVKSKIFSDQKQIIKKQIIKNQLIKKRIQQRLMKMQQRLIIKP